MLRLIRALRAMPVVSAIAAAGFAAAAASPPFAALTVTPAGPQSYDISTGVTTLPDGGTVVDQDTGVSLRAQRLSYVGGEYVDGSAARVTGAFGTLRADSIHIDVKRGVLTAAGHLSLVRGALTLTCDKLSYDANRQVADFTGSVTGSSPDFTAGRLLLDARSGNVLLLGDYSYANGPFTLKAPRGGGRLELTLHQVDGKPVYDAATEISPELLARFAAELN